MRLVLLSPMCSGNHWVARSVSRATGVGYKIPWHLTEGWPTRPDYIVATHEPWTDGIVAATRDSGAAVIGMYRNPLDHLVSYMRMFAIPTEKAVEAAASPPFRFQRDIAASIPEDRRISYDRLCEYAQDQEAARLADLVGLDMPVIMESIDRTRRNEPGYARIGIVGAWKDVLSPQVAATVCAVLGETVPE